MATDVLAAFRGDRFVYVGEGYGGCTGDDVFHELLEEEWTEMKTIEIPQWPCIHDQMTVYGRKR